MGISNGRAVRGTRARLKPDAIKNTAAKAKAAREPITVKIHDRDGDFQEGEPIHEKLTRGAARAERQPGGAPASDLGANTPRAILSGMRRTAEELRAFSQHLLYEVQMLFRLADRLRAHTDGAEQLSWEVEMACIESFAIHMRALEQFVWGDGKGDRFPDDAFASDYFPAGE